VVKNNSETLNFSDKKKKNMKREYLYPMQTLEEYCSPEIQPSICAQVCSAFHAQVEYYPNYSDRQQRVKGPQAMSAWPCRHGRIIIC